MNRRDLAFLVAPLAVLATPGWSQTAPGAAPAQAEPTAEELTRALNSGPPRPVTARPAPAPVAAPVQAPAPAARATSAPAQRPAARPVTPPARPAAEPARSSEASALTQQLNRMPPRAAAAVRPTPAPTSTPAPTPAQRSAAVAAPSAAAPRETVPVQAAEPVRRDVAPGPSVAAPAPTVTPVAARPVATPSRPEPVVDSAPPSRPVAQARPAQAGPEAAPAPARAATSTRPAAVPAGVLSAEELAALPFRIDLPQGVQLAETRSAPGAGTWTLRKGPVTLAMIYAGPQSQFPIFDGDQVTVAGRTSVVVTEGTRRIAMEHLFQQAKEPAEIHIWVMAASGNDRGLAERIAQTVDPR